MMTGNSMSRMTGRLLRRGVLLLAVLLSVAMPARGQRGEFFRNSFLSVGAEANYFLEGVGGGVDVTYGKWLLTSMGMKGQYVFALSTSPDGDMQPYHLFHYDLFFDPLTALRGRNLSDVWRMYFDIGFGYVNCRNDNDFLATCGLGVDRRIGENWRLYAELSTMLFPAKFVRQDNLTLMPRLSLGATCDIAHNPTRSRSHNESRDFAHDWYFQVGMGVCSFNYKGIGSFGDRAKLFTPIFDFGIGKNFTSLWSARLCLSGLYAKSRDEVFSYGNVRGDILLNLFNCLFPQREWDRFDLVPYASGSFLSRLDDTEHFMITLAAGLIMSVHMDSRNVVFLDARYLLTPSRFAHISTPQTTLSVGMATVMLGYSYHFSRRSI